MQSKLVKEDFVFAKVVEASADNLQPLLTPTPAAAHEPNISDFVPAQTQKDVGWAQLTPEQQKRVVEAVMLERAMNKNYQSVDQVVELKKKIESLNEKQATILNSFAETKKEDKDNRTAINRIVGQYRQGD